VVAAQRFVPRLWAIGRESARWDDELVSSDQLLQLLAPLMRGSRALVVALQLHQIEDPVHRRGRPFVLGSSTQPLEAGNEVAVRGGPTRREHVTVEPVSLLL